MDFTRFDQWMAQPEPGLLAVDKNRYARAQAVIFHQAIFHTRVTRFQSVQGLFDRRPGYNHFFLTIRQVA
jgi:hypothetical protein